MEIKSLPQNVRDILRSIENVSSVSQCVMELVLNSLDAKATAIAIRINLLTLRIQVVDNGIGVTESNMNVIGVRYMTSKCHSLSDLKKIRGYGFRGEALASICQMAKKVELTSRAEDRECTYSKTYENGKWSSLEALKTRPGTGTTVTVTEFMYKLPVRKNRIRKNLDLDETKRRIEELAIINCKVSFSLRNDATGKIVLQSSQIKNVAKALINFYPKITIGELCQVKVSKSKISVNGLIYKLSSTNPKLQLIFLNKRPINCVKIQKFINNLLSKNVSKGEHPVYCLNVRCPYSNVDLMITSSKTTAEFKNWEIVRKCIEKAVKVVVQDEKSEVVKLPVVLEKAPSYKSQFGLSLISGAVQGHRVKRKMKSNSVPRDTKTNVEHSNLNLSPKQFLEINESEKVNVTKDNKIECLTNYTPTTKNLENTDKGKELLMNMFLKSTTAYHTKRPPTDDIKTVVLGKTTRNKFANTTMTMTIVSKKTILKNPHLVGCQKQNMISKCVQTTMVQHHTGLVDFESNVIRPNVTFSKYFTNFNSNSKEITFFGNFGEKNFLPNFTKPEYFFRPIAQTSFNFLKDCLLFDGKRRNIFNFSSLNQNPFPKFHQRVNNNRGALLPKKRKFHSNMLFNTFSPYFAKNFSRKPLIPLPNATNNFAIVRSPYFKQPNTNIYQRKRKKQDCKSHVASTNFFHNHIPQPNKKPFANLFEANQKLVGINFIPNFINCAETDRDYDKDAHYYCHLNAKRIRLNHNARRENDHKSKFTSHIVKVPEVIQSNIFPKESSNSAVLHKTMQHHKTVVFRPPEKPNLLQENQHQKVNFHLISNVHQKNVFDNNSSVQRANTESASFNHTSKFKSHIVKVPDVMQSNIYSKELSNSAALHKTIQHHKTVVFQPPEKANLLQENQRQKFNLNLISNIQQKNVFDNNSLVQRANTEFFIKYDQKPIEHFENLNSEPLFEATPTSDEKDVLITDSSISVHFLSNYTKNPISSIKNGQKSNVLNNKINEMTNYKKFLFESPQPLLFLEMSTNRDNQFCDQSEQINQQNQLQITPFQFSNMESASNAHNVYKSNNLNTPSFLFPNNNQLLCFDNESPKQFNQNLFQDSLKKHNCTDEVTKGSKIIKDKSHAQKHNNKLSLKRHVSSPIPKPKTIKTLKPITSFSESTSFHDYNEFKPDLCSTRINAPIDHCDPNNVSKPALDVNTKTPEWLQKKDYLGNKFYLNVRTGMTSMYSPKHTDKFSMAKRIDFVPKGLSPIMVESKKIDVSMSPHSKKALHDVLIESYKSELETIKWSNLIDNHTDINVFFQKLYEQKTKLFENSIPNVSLNTLPKSVVKQYNNNQAQSYSKDFLINLDIIGQWDKKFIVAFCKTKQTLFLFDQHAVSERIRLEKLLKDYKDGEKFKSSRCDVRIFKAFSESELNLLTEFEIVFHHLGIQYSVRENALYISHIPMCVYSKPHDNGFEQMKNLVISVICEQLQALKMTRGVGMRIPEILQNIVNSEACRGAIKFGDQLSENDCVELIKELHNCQLPFQCAHGRPSVVPLLNLEKRFLLERGKPNLRKLTKC